MSFYGDIQRWWIGTVEEDSGKTDPNRLGRCRVRIDGIHGPNISLDDLPYAQAILPATGGGTSGIGENPQLLPGAKVIGFFLDGMLSQLPVIWGFLPHTATPSIIQQEIIAKEKRSIIQTHSSRDFRPKSNNIKNPSVASSNVERAMDFFTGPHTKRKYSRKQAAGIVGNLIEESTAALDPLINEVGGGTASSIDGSNRAGFGIAQWTKTAERYKNLKKFGEAKGKGSLGFTDFMVQLAFIDHELDTLKWTRGGIFECQTVMAATMQFMRYYLRPQFFKDASILHTRADGGKAPGKNENPIRRRIHEDLRLKNANAVYINDSQEANK